METRDVKPGNLPAYVAVMTSHSFLLLAVVLFHAGYSTRTIVGQVVQYLLSTSIWTPYSSKPLIWVDRSMACINILVLCSEHLSRGLTVNDMLPTLAWTISFKLVDYYFGGTECSPWYVCWHVNLLVNNATIALGKYTLPQQIFYMQHFIAACVFATLHFLRSPRKDM